jgi:hypothetical protein
VLPLLGAGIEDWYRGKDCDNEGVAAQYPKVAGLEHVGFAS